MAHSRSALKRWRQSLDARERNRSTKSRTRTLLNKAISTVGSDGAEDAVRAAVSALDKAAQKGVIHPNAAARSKSRLLKRFNLAVAGAVASAAAASGTGAAATEEKAPPASPRRGTIPRRASSQPNTTKSTPAKPRTPRSKK